MAVGIKHRERDLRSRRIPPATGPSAFRRYARRPPFIAAAAVSCGGRAAGEWGGGRKALARSLLIKLIKN